MRQPKAAPSPEQLADYAARALFIDEMAMDASTGTAYLLCKKSRLEINHTIIAVPSDKLASLSITFIQVAQAVRDAASRIAAGVQAQ